MSLTAKDEPLELPGRPAPYLGFLSRRSFLKAIGATALSGVATTLPLPPHLARAARRGQEPLDELWEIVTLSPLFEQTIAGLGTYQITFDLNPLNFIPIAEYGSLVGMKLAHLSAPSQRTGA
ncbi:MAG: twin-arginine translocation signal domain-containing protein, partial [Ardenticatenaceae bacterium]